MWSLESRLCGVVLWDRREGDDFYHVVKCDCRWRWGKEGREGEREMRAFIGFKREVDGHGFWKISCGGHEIITIEENIKWFLEFFRIRIRLCVKVEDIGLNDYFIFYIKMRLIRKWSKSLGALRKIIYERCNNIRNI